MKTFGIQTPCTEDWNGMTPSEKGAFCQKCAKHVHDFSNKSNHEIKSTLLELSGQSLCVRMTTRQEDELNAEFKAWLSHKKRNPQQLFIAALLIVFGLALFSCEDERDQRKIESVQQIAYNIASEQTDKMETAPAIDSLSEPAPPEIVRSEEYYTVGAYYVPFVQAPPPEPKAEEIIEEHILGGIGSISYATFLEETTKDVELDENGVPYPTEFKALTFPNPAVESTTLEIQVPEKERMDIRLYDASGKFIREIHSGKVSRGAFRQQIDLNDLNSGLYLIIIQSKAFKETVRVVKN
ncbi:T9SS type A sorting domain-containing protein [uncultured Fluviicola sp.]|uniref:T9SS type A sorting domain-containing protein n=1 Tax=uncultured Fluviicola sp. TaxID=463303 RepID=UPI0025D38F50|nr:T9SS type A sorting domain-containing protein [uncultured Fluviicola sp.]